MRLHGNPGTAQRPGPESSSCPQVVPDRTVGIALLPSFTRPSGYWS